MKFAMLYVHDFSSPLYILNLLYAGVSVVADCERISENTVNFMIFFFNRRAGKRNEQKRKIQNFRLRCEWRYSIERKKHLLVSNKYLLQVSQEVSPDRRNKRL